MLISIAYETHITCEADKAQIEVCDHGYGAYLSVREKGSSVSMYFRNDKETVALLKKLLKCCSRKK